MWLKADELWLITPNSILPGAQTCNTARMLQHLSQLCYATITCMPSPMHMNMHTQYLHEMTSSVVGVAITLLHQTACSREGQCCVYASSCKVPLVRVPTCKEKWCNHCCWQQLYEEAVERCEEVKVPAGHQQAPVVGHHR